MSIVSITFFALTGTIGFYACYIFVRKASGLQEGWGQGTHGFVLACCC